MMNRTQSRPKVWRQSLGAGLAAVLFLPLLLLAAPSTAEAGRVFAEVVALDQQIYYNRLGAVNPIGMIYALKRDVVHFPGGLGADCGNLPADVDGMSIAERGSPPAIPGCVRLRDDKRPRPIVLRANEGDFLTIRFTNLVNPVPPVAENPNADIFPPEEAQFDDQGITRHVGMHVQGMELLRTERDDGSFVGENVSSLAAPGQTLIYQLNAVREGTHLIDNAANQTGNEGSNGTDSFGLFGLVNVELPGSIWYRSQVSRLEMDLVTTGRTPGGQPIINYDARYPADATDARLAPIAAAMGFADAQALFDAKIAGKQNLPILKILDRGRIIHSDMHAIIHNPNGGTSWANGRVEPANPAYPSRNQSFRELSVLFHDEITAIQPFPIFIDPVFNFTLSSVKDGFAINYGSGGIGSEILANRLGLGPMADCPECKYEEFFLTSWTVGDPAMVVDVTANLSDPANGVIATKAIYPDDAANVWPAYLNDRVKMRNSHIGTEHHIFHLHAHQWLFTPDLSDSNYLDAQGIGPGSSFTYEIAYDAGNRNKTPGDAIFHCHFYPHFAQGMWGLFRIHDVFENGTLLDPDGFPTPEADGTVRALPDGEIVRGVPIYALVPIPNKAMAPMPEKVHLVAQVNDFGAGPVEFGSDVVVADGAANPGNPGFPFFIEGLAGHRPPTAPLDILVDEAGEKHDGGLPRHFITGGVALGTETTRTFFKELEEAEAEFPPEEGTAVEQAAMTFHEFTQDVGGGVKLPFYDSFLPDGSPANDAAGFQVNGMPRVAGAPFADPCRNDFDVDPNFSRVNFFPDFGTDTPPAVDRTYKAANIQLDMVLNKVGWHFPQARIISLWQDVADYIDGNNGVLKPPEPFVMRINTYECAQFQHTNLVPNIYIGDDFQVETPTDVIGQHIHLLKFDVTAADGAANGWNYEDGTLSPGEVQERVRAMVAHNAAHPGDQVINPNTGVAVALTDVQPHPFFKNVLGADRVDPWTQEAGVAQNIVMGARTTIQRWFLDPLQNNDGVERGLGNIFTHDHFGPSTHQQVGLYATVLTEPEDSTWRHAETGEYLGTRPDGGPTSWQAIIEGGATAAQGGDYREFYFEYADFGIAYEIGADITRIASRVEGGVIVPADADGDPATEPAFHFGAVDAVNPSDRKETALANLVNNPWNFEDPIGLVAADGFQRPRPEAISAADPGTFMVNYRAEPLGHRVLDPAVTAFPRNPNGSQAAGDQGDLSLAYASILRADPRLNCNDGVVDCNNHSFPDPNAQYAPLNSGITEFDPYTPAARAYVGDKVRIRMQVGATEESHYFTVHNQKWQQEFGSNFTPLINSGWRNTQHAGISEQFQAIFDIISGPGQLGNVADYLYKPNASVDAQWTGSWGLLRTYQEARDDLAKLKYANPYPKAPNIANKDDFIEMCPRDVNDHDYDGDYDEPENRRFYDVTAVLAKDVLPEVALDNGDPILTDPALQPIFDPDTDGDVSTLIYNSRINDGLGNPAGPLHDPTAILYVMTEDLEEIDDDKYYDDDNDCDEPYYGPGNGERCRLKANAPIEPIILRAAAGDCVEVKLRNRLPKKMAAMPDLDGRNMAPNVIDKWDLNQVRPSNSVGLHPQLLAYEVTTDDGFNVGSNVANNAGGLLAGKLQTVAPGAARTYRWYAGDVKLVGSKLVATPIEFGATGLSSTDPLKQGNKGAVGALIVLPKGAEWEENDTVSNRQPLNVGDGDRRTRTMADVFEDYNGNGYLDKDNNEFLFRDLVLVQQDEINFRFSGIQEQNFGGDISPGFPAGPLESFAGELEPEDSGHKGLNYAAEPTFFRLGHGPALSPEGQRNVDQSNLFSNVQIGGLDPETPVFTAAPKQEVRIRYLKPSSKNRAGNVTVHGHIWQREPHASSAGDSSVIGFNDLTNWHGEQMGLGGSGHWDIIPQNGAGGTFGVEADYLIRDTAPTHSDSGEWGLLRVKTPTP